MKKTPALQLSWQFPDSPIPVKAIQKALTNPSIRVPDSLGHETDFHFSHAMTKLVANIALFSPEMAHINVSRLLFTIVESRNQNSHGLQARVTPLRFKDGKKVVSKGGKLYQIQTFHVNQTEILYLVTFSLPRFLNQTFEEKLITLFHELYHIHPGFNGDLRRHPGRHSLHTSSKISFDTEMANIAREYLRRSPDSQLYRFLRYPLHQLLEQYGTITGYKVPHPKLVEITGREKNP